MTQPVRVTRKMKVTEPKSLFKVKKVGKKSQKGVDAMDLD